MIQLPNFLPSDIYADLEHFARTTATYSDVENPIDHVVYPLICKDLPENLVHILMIKLSNLMNRNIKNITLFLRMSTEGVIAPNQVHTDNSMGRYSFMLYLDTNDKAGTSFLQHKETGATDSTQPTNILDILKADSNDKSKWTITNFCPMIANTGCLFDSRDLHRAEPIGGYGTSAKNGRIVLTCFFS